MLIELSPLQCRVLGVLLEKEVTTPDQYPLSLNALTLGCNQKSSREPILSLSEAEVQQVVDELIELKQIREVSGFGARVAKYQHRFCNTEFGDLKFTPQQLAIVCVLMLRQAQTPGELRTRCARMAEFRNAEEVERILEGLQNHHQEQIVQRLPPQPGKREARYQHCFTSGEAATSVQTVDAVTASPTDQSDLAQRVATLESQVATLQSQIQALLDNQ